MKTYRFDDILLALVNSVRKANTALKKKEANAFTEYFFKKRDDGVLSPNTYDMWLPRKHIEGDQEPFGVHEVPEAVLTNHDGIRVENVEINLEAVIEEIGEDEQGEPVLCMTVGSIVSKAQKVVQVKIIISHSVPPEGVVRVNDQLLKLF